MHHFLPAGVQAAFDLAGVVPVFLPKMNRPAWLSKSVTLSGRPALLIDADVSPEQLDEIADRILIRMADRLDPGDLPIRP